MKIERIEQFLAATPMLAGLSPEDRLRLVQCADEVTFRPGDYLARTGYPADRFFIVVRGRVQLEVSSPARDPVALDVFGPHEIVGWSWLLAPYHWHLDARALDDTLTLGLDGATLRVWMDADPAFGYALLRPFATVIVQRLQAARMRLLA